MTGLWWRQILAVIRLEMRKTFFARRGLWVYLLALAPVLLFMGHAIQAPRERQRLARIAAAHRVPTEALQHLRRGTSRGQVLKLLGPPYEQWIRYHRVGERERIERGFYRYTDGKSSYLLFFDDAKLMVVRRQAPTDFPEDNLIFAGVFQFFYLRLAVFFGCVGIFMNLFRGELLDKSLHFYLLTPIRREALVAGKYLAGLIATVVIFTASTALQLLAMLSQYPHFGGPGLGHLGGYLAVTVLACIAYGSLFLAVGLFFRNPIIAAAVILVWESAILFLPVSLKKLSLIYYLQSMCPVAPPADNTLPISLASLISAAEPTRTSVAIGGLLILTLALLVASAFRARRLEINYGTD